MGDRGSILRSRQRCGYGHYLLGRCFGEADSESVAGVSVIPRRRQLSTAGCAGEPDDYGSNDPRRSAHQLDDLTREYGTARTCRLLRPLDGARSEGPRPGLLRAADSAVFGLRGGLPTPASTSRPPHLDTRSEIWAVDALLRRRKTVDLASARKRRCLVFLLPVSHRTFGYVLSCHPDHRSLLVEVSRAAAGEMRVTPIVTGRRVRPRSRRSTR
jgi:hypothetical protein